MNICAHLIRIDLTVTQKRLEAAVLIKSSVFYICLLQFVRPSYTRR
jgi:hypothetical protein